MSKKKISLTRAFEHYVKSKDIYDLISYKDIPKIKNQYKEFLKENQLPLDDNDNNIGESDDSDFYYKKKESNYYSSENENESSSSSENENIENNNARSDNNDNDDDSDGDNDNNYKKEKNVNKHSFKEKKIKGIKIKNNIQKTMIIKNNNNKNINKEKLDLFSFNNIIKQFNSVPVKLDIDTYEIKQIMNESHINFKLKIRKDALIKYFLKKRNIIIVKDY